MPYALLANVVSVKTGKPFLDNMERFGFIPDAESASNPHGLLIGLTTVRSRDKTPTAGNHVFVQPPLIPALGPFINDN